MFRAIVFSASIMLGQPSVEMELPNIPITLSTSSIDNQRQTIDIGPWYRMFLDQVGFHFNEEVTLVIKVKHYPVRDFGLLFDSLGEDVIEYAAGSNWQDYAVGGHIQVSPPTPTVDQEDNK
jgi:hypothetical protein